MLIEEAHLISPEAGNGMYRQLLTDLDALGGPIPLIGLTATPWRLTSGRLDRHWRGNPALFERIIHEVGIRDPGLFVPAGRQAHGGATRDVRRQRAPGRLRGG